MASIQSFEIERMESEITRLTAQRDALLAACVFVSAELDTRQDNPADDTMRRVVRNAINNSRATPQAKEE